VNKLESMIKFQDGRYDSITVKLYDAPTAAGAVPTMLKSLDLTRAFHDMTKATIQNIKAKSAPADTTFTIKFMASKGAEEPVSLFEKTVVVQPATATSPSK